MSFRNIQFIDDEYISLTDDIIKSFYIPCLKEAKEYKRATAYFSSAVLLQITKGLSPFVKNGGKVYLIVSPNLEKEDYEAIKSGYDARKKAEECLIKDFDENIDFDQKNERFTLLSYLIEHEILEIKVAIPTTKSKHCIYHEKLGIMTDNLNNKVVFSGSANETIQGYDLNYESIDVYCDWKSDDASSRCYKKEKRFDRMWEDAEDNLVVTDFPTIIKEKILKYNDYEKIDFEQLDLDLEKIIMKKSLKSGEPKLISSGLYKYQEESIDAWEKSEYKGSLVLATGAGKTYIGCGAIVRIYKKIKRCFVVICCPYTHLVDQWAEDVKAFNISPLTYYSSTKNYDEVKREIYKFATNRSNFSCLITTNGSYITSKMQKLLKINEKNTLIIADEAHNFGAKTISKYMNENIPYRLALSATLERYGDLEGTKKIINYFGPIRYSYSLEQAILDDKLTKYNYYPILVYFNEDEYDRYLELTNKIRKFHIDKEKEQIPQGLKKLLLARARIIAETKDKIRALKEVLCKYKNENNILIYCGAVKYESDKSDEEEVKQIKIVRDMLKNEFKMVATSFTSEENNEERREIIRAFKNQEIQAIVAIRCLDEGVNIPAIKTAFILASSTNPKEYIQRRGRVLRKFEGKEYAEIYDFITLPREIENQIAIPEKVKTMEKSLVRREFSRMQDFAKLSKNPSCTYELMEKIRTAYNLDIIEGDEKYE